jgi:hypothetical protein
MNNKNYVKYCHVLVFTYDIMFYAVTLGVLIDDPIILDPEMRIPL